METEEVVNPQRWALVVRVLSGRSFQSDSARRSSRVSLKIGLDDIVKHTSFAEVTSGRVRWNQEIIFVVADVASANLLLNVNTVRHASLRPKESPATTIAARLFADIGTESSAGWFQIEGNEEVKLSIFWRALAVDAEVAAEESSPAETKKSPAFRRVLFPPRAASDYKPSATNNRKIVNPAEVIIAHDEESVNFQGGQRPSLKVTVHAAKDLRAVNMGGKSDPFVLLAIRGTRRKTNCIKNTLNPVWFVNNSFDFGDVEDLDDEDEVQLVVKDWDPLGRYKDLGQVTISMKQVIESTSVENVWFQLNPTIYMPEKLQREDCGSIQLSVSYTPQVKSSERHLPQSPPKHSTGLSSVESPAEAKSLKPSSGSARSVIASENESKTSERPKLFVRLIQARNLFASDFGGVSDPYVVIRCKGETRKTTTRLKTLTPIYDYECIFGEKEFLNDNDELELRVVDQDSTISSIVDDDIGFLKIPLWSLLRDDLITVEQAMSEPKWYSLESPSVKQKCAGEVQLALYYSNPKAKKADIWKGKVFLFELQATVLTARNLNTMSADPRARIKPYCTISCGRNDKWKTTTASNGVNPTWSERFRFRRTADTSSDRDGLLHSDLLKINVYNSATAESLGQLVLDVGAIVDRLGYFDVQGKALTSWFDLTPTNSEDDAGDAENDADDATDADSQQELLTDASDASFSVRQKARDLGNSLRRRLTGPALTKRSSSMGSASSAPVTPVDSPSASPVPGKADLAAISALDLDAITGSDDKLRRSPTGQIRLTLKLLPIGETRLKSKKKLSVYLEEFAGQMSSTGVPRMVYAKCKVGYDTKITPNMPLHVLHGSRVDAGLHALLNFEEEVDWLLQEAAKRRANEEKLARRSRHLSNSLAPSKPAHVVQDKITVSLYDATTDQLLSEATTTFIESILHRTPFQSNPALVIGGGAYTGSFKISFKVVEIKEEMVPLLGHLYLRMLQFKSTAPPRFEQSLGFVVRYGVTIASKPIVGDPCPNLLAANGPDFIRFPVFNAFKNVTIEVWQSKKGPGGSDGAEGSQAFAFAKSVLSVFKRSESNDLPDTTDGVETNDRATRSKWGHLLCSSTLTLFDLIEIEAQTVFEEEVVTQGVPEKAFKLRLRGKSGKQQGTMWMEGRYAENVGGVLSPNPNPPVQPGKPFSLANFRHEINRLTKIVGWLSSFGAHVSGLLNWDSPTKTVSTIVAITVICSVDWFSSRWLIVFPACMLIHMVNRHRLRANGMFLSDFEETDIEEGGMSAEVRVACISAQPADPPLQPWRKVHAEVSLIPRPGKQSKLLGFTRVDARLENNQVDFVSSKLGYGTRASVKARPSVHMWKFSEMDPAVPSFSFRAENYTVLKETILCVTLFCAKNLIAADANGLSDPFVRLNVRDAVTGQTAGDSYRSSVRPKTLNPIWNERFILGEKKAVAASNILVLNFFDSDVMSTSKDPLGDIEIDLSHLQAMFPSGPPDASSHQRAIMGRRWLPLQSPKNAKRRYFKRPSSPTLEASGSFEFGEVCLHVEWVRVDTMHQKKNKALKVIDDIPLGLDTPLEGTEAGETGETDEGPVDTWTSCGASVAIDLFDQKETFLGRASVPIGALVLSDEERIQPQLELNLPLLSRFDGSKDDIKMTEELIKRGAISEKLGMIKCRLMVTLPDPKAKERRMAMLEAKRADRSNVLQKLRMITKHLERIQGQLAAVNNRAERFKNVFNWSHPRRTELMFNLMIFLSVLFILIPSRFFILMIVLFFFTEKFRHMGTMGARFKHLLSQLPTDDDLRAVVQGDAASGKRKVSGQRNVIQPSSSPRLQSNARRLSQTGRRKSENSEGPRSSIAKGENGEVLPKHELQAKIQNITASDAIFSGSLSFSKISKNDTVKVSDFGRRYFILSNVGMHYWADHDAMEGSQPLGHFLEISDVGDDGLPSVAACARPECLFSIETESAAILFFASSEVKKKAWINAIKSAM